jgi:hypothetical protein
LNASFGSVERRVELVLAAEFGEGAQAERQREQSLR